MENTYIWSLTVRKPRISKKQKTPPIMHITHTGTHSSMEDFIECNNYILLSYDYYPLPSKHHEDIKDKDILF